MPVRYTRKDVFGACQEIGKLLGREVAAEGDRKPGALGVYEGMDNHMMVVMWGPRGRAYHDVFGTGLHKPKPLCFILGGIIQALDLAKEAVGSRFTRDFEARAKASAGPPAAEEEPAFPAVLAEDIADMCELFGKTP